MLQQEWQEWVAIGKTGTALPVLQLCLHGLLQHGVTAERHLEALNVFSIESTQFDIGQLVACAGGCWQLQLRMTKAREEQSMCLTVPVQLAMPQR